MRKILVLSLALILILGIMSHGTSSYFSDTETSAGNTFTAWTTECEGPCGNNYIALVNDTWDGTNSTWTYEITSGTQPALSHWVIEWCDCSAVEAVHEYDQNGVLIPGTEWECGYFDQPNGTDLYGIKIENPVNEYGDGETRIVEIVLTGDYAIGQVAVGMKSGQDIDISTMCGPLCCEGHHNPVVTVIYPNDWVVWYVGLQYTIRWNVTDADGDHPLTIDIDFSRDSGASYGYHIATIQQNSLGNYQYKWTIPDDPQLVSDHCRIRVTATDRCGSGWDASDHDFCPRLPPPPEVTVISPNGGQWQAGETYPITWIADGVCPEMMLIDAYLSINDGYSWIKILSDEENDGVCQWEVPAGIPASDKARIKVIAKYPIIVSGQDDSDEAFSILSSAEPPPPELGLSEAYNLVVDKSEATLTAEGETACGIVLNDSSGEGDIVINKLVISWDPASEDSRVIEIWSLDEMEYAAELTSGSEWDIPDFVLAAGEERSLSFILNNGAAGESINVEFIMSDGSIVMVSFRVVTD
jgi:predicted ribosomally synthesized peptide with SipW-like signal peptide